MASHGGYREPANPAQVSGPGAMSKRTDGGQVNLDLPNAQYGENADYHDIQSGAPVASALQPADQGNPQAQALMGQLTPMGAASGQPGVPVTDGADAGAGRGSSALGLGGNPLQDHARQLARTGVLQLMVTVADGSDASADYRSYVRTLLGAL